MENLSIEEFKRLLSSEKQLSEYLKIQGNRDVFFKELREQLLKRLCEDTFWDRFFSCFMNTVHPVEFAVRVPDRGNGQKEESLSAAFHRTFFQHRFGLGMEHWVPVLEAPVMPNSSNPDEYFFCDLTFTPWVSDEDASWEAAKERDKHVRIEVKWHEQKREIYHGILSKIATIASKPHLIIALNFTSNNSNCGFKKGENYIKNNKKFNCIYSNSRERTGAKFGEKYNKFWLMVFQPLDQ
jgi:hypothetical protein